MALCMTALVPAHGESLTPAQALGRLNDSSTLPHKVRAVQAPQPQLLATGVTAGGTPAYYVFDSGAITLFVSADDVAFPLLGYTDGSFDPACMPPAMEWWLGQYSRQIEIANAGRLRAAALSRADDDRLPIAPLLTTQWNQSAPYNDLCPLKNDQVTYTGCVATSTAQVMGYWRWPAKGNGLVSYDWNNRTLSLDLSQTALVWDDMLPTYADATSGTDGQRLAVATLMRACGYALHMNYGLAEDGGSSALGYDVAPALINHFDYDKAIHNEEAIFYAPDVWEDMIYANLRDCGPMVYGGRNEGGGHSFVCDGYDTDGLFHINWGWNGMSDGYFRLTALDPSDQGAGGSSAGYNDGQHAVLGIRPPVAGSRLAEPYIGCESELYAISEGRKITVQAKRIEYASRFANYGCDEAVFSLGLRLSSLDDGEPVYAVAFTDRTIAMRQGPGWIETEIPAEVPDGSYLVTPVYRVGDGDWKAVRRPWNADSPIAIDIVDGDVVVAPDCRPYSLGVVWCDCTALTSGEPFVINARVYNNSDEPVTETIDCDLVDRSHLTPDGVGMSYMLLLDPADVTVPAKGYADIQYEGEIPEDAWTGDFSLEFYRGVYVYGRFPVVVIDPAAIVAPEVDADSSDVRCYDLLGRPVSPSYSGMHIRLSRGKAQKGFQY
ncbi:MAG: C10 family peptidase [Bacteroidales bacterium]|nr:C10 family peptidase [Bacteroidales bacterium]